MNDFGLPSTPINPHTAHKIASTQKELDSVLSVMRNNIQSVLERDEKLANLNFRVDMLESGAGEFLTTARTAKRRAWIRGRKLDICLAISASIAVFLAFYLVIDAFMNPSYGNDEVVKILTENTRS